MPRRKNQVIIGHEVEEQVAARVPYEKYRVKITLLTPMLGTVPKDEKTYSAYIELKKQKALKELGVEIDPSDETILFDEEKRLTGFHSDENGLYLLDYQVKGMFKEYGNVLKDVLGVAALKSKIENFLFVEPRKIYLGKKEPDGIIERPLRAQTAQGQRVTIARSEYVDAGTTFYFDILLIPGPVTINVARAILDYGKLKGFGQWRNGGYGRFDYKITDRT